LDCSYCKKLEKYDFGDFIMETSHWIIFLAPQQSNIGTCVVALNRHESDLSGLTRDEWLDFGKLVREMEETLKKCFDVTLFNWGSLMNASYLKQTPDPHVHWHLIPRYDHAVEFEGLVFEDLYFGTMKPRPFRGLPEDVRGKIINFIKDNHPCNKK
jgi:diadenosine tetraphosphate (Ap4A) HIT family hydrolase